MIKLREFFLTVNTRWLNMQVPRKSVAFNWSL